MNWKRSFVVTAGVALPLIALLAFGMTRDPRNIPSPLPGRKAPEFTRPVFATGDNAALAKPVGDSVSLASMRGQVVVLNFWASWCLACRDEHEDLSLAASNFAGMNVKFVGMLYNDKEQYGLDWIEKMGGQSYPSLSDPGARTAIDYGLYGVPETFVIDQRGIVAHKFTGPVSEPQLRKLIDSLLVANGGVPKDAPVSRVLPPADAPKP
jgi:cytochrome c biogenesis protein CcmG/thiol:disulfide interchange protein DsbE